MLFQIHWSIPFHLQLEIGGISPGEADIENIENMHKKKFAGKNYSGVTGTVSQNVELRRELTI